MFYEFKLTYPLTVEANSPEDAKVGALVTVRDHFPPDGSLEFMGEVTETPEHGSD